LNNCEKKGRQSFNKRN